MTYVGTLATIAGLSVLATTSVAFAHGPGSIDRTQAVHQQKIEAARRAGELTRREYFRLQQEQAHIAALERQAKADGYLSRREFRSIRQAQHEAGRHIHQESHDRQVNWWRLWHSRNRY